MSDFVDLKEFVTGFLIEAEEYLGSINRHLVAVSDALKENRAEPRSIRELFRSLHTIKGLSSMVGAEPIVVISHEMEGILRSADKAGGRIPDRTLDLLVKGTRAIEERVGLISKNGVTDLPEAPASLIEALAHVQRASTENTQISSDQFSIEPEILASLTASDREQIRQALKARQRVVQIDFEPSAENSKEGFTITSVREKLSKLGELVKVAPRSSTRSPTGIRFSLIVITEAQNADLAVAAKADAKSIVDVRFENQTASAIEVGFEDFESEVDWTPSDHSSIRVDVRRLDEALERLSELIVTRSKLALTSAKLAARGVDVRELNVVVAENARQLKRLRVAINQARMIPLKELLQRLPLVVRGLTKDTEKSVNLVMQVGAAEVDKAVADKIFPAIVHIIRNAVDHAIEIREQRKALGKKESAEISVVCDNSSGTNLVITIRDDGAGIDREAVAKKLGTPIAKSNEDLLAQIAKPGLSTRENVTTTSGRGMGMDIVKRTIEMLGGQLQLVTEKGKGTTFTLLVPVSVTIVDVLSFVSGGQTFAVSVAMIDEILEVKKEDLVKSPVPGKDGIEPYLIERRGEAIPYLSLSSLLKSSSTNAVRNALIVNQRRGGTMAFGVDRMLGQQEVVVRPLEDQLVRVAGMAGATDLGDGQPTLILDLATMGDLASRQHMEML